MAEKSLFRKSKVFYILSAIVFILLVAAFFFWRSYKYKLVNNKLDKLITVKSKGLYQLNYKNLVINEALGNISAENVELIPDSLTYQSLIEQNKAPENLFYFHIPSLTITGVKTPRALLNKEISAHIIKIENAGIEIRVSKESKERKSGFSNKLRADIYYMLLARLNSIMADSIILENANVTIVDLKSKAIQCKVSGFSFRLSGLEIDSLTQYDSTRILFSRNLDIHCNQIELPSKNKVYNFQVNGLDFNSQTNHLHSDQIKCRPLLSETDFAKSNKFAKDRLDIVIGSLDIWQVKLLPLTNQELIADSLEISEASFRIFRDKSYPHDSVDRTHDFPQEAIMRLPVPIFIYKILVRRSYIEYKEKNDKSDSSGKVAFYNVEAEFKNVTNMPAYIKRNNQTSLHFSSSFLNKAVFDANIRMRLNDKSGNFQMDALLGEMDASSLNTLLKPMALADLEKGKIVRLSYRLDATNQNGKGRLMLLYNNLSLKLLKKDDVKNKYKTKFLPTLAANIALKNSNPQNGKTRVGNIDYRRDIHTSIFNLMWKSLFACIKQVAL